MECFGDWKSYKYYKRKLFLCLPQKQRKHNQHSKTAIFFYNKCTVCQIKPNIYKQKTKFTSCKQYLFPFLTSRYAKKTRADQTIPLVFSKEMARKPLKVAAAKTLFFSVYIIATTCFDEYFLFYVITRRHCFSWKFIVTLKFQFAPLRCFL